MRGEDAPATGQPTWVRGKIRASMVHKGTSRGWAQGPLLATILKSWVEDHDLLLGVTWGKLGECGCIAR